MYKFLSQIEFSNSKLSLIHGDLTKIPPTDKADIVVVSAFPNNYEPYLNTLVGNFYSKGLDVGLLAKNKAQDLRSSLGCWLSQPLTAEQQAYFNFKRILCFEPKTQSHNPWEVVSSLFRCINNFAFDEEINRVAMPLLATGNQSAPFEEMFPSILESAFFWLEQGLPVESIDIVVYNDHDAERSLQIFESFKENKNDLIDYNDKDLIMPAPEEAGYDGGGDGASEDAGGSGVGNGGGGRTFIEPRTGYQLCTQAKTGSG